MTQTYRRVWLHDFGLAFGKSTRPLAWIDIVRVLSALNAKDTALRMATKNHV